MKFRSCERKLSAHPLPILILVDGLICFTCLPPTRNGRLRLSFLYDHVQLIVSFTNILSTPNRHCLVGCSRLPDWVRTKMVRLQSTTPLQCLVYAPLIGVVMGQGFSDEQAASTLSSAPSITSSGSSPDNSGLIATLWSEGESLLSSVYPSTSWGNIATLTWPSTVAIGSSTYLITHSSTISNSAASASSTSESTESRSASSDSTKSSSTKSNSAISSSATSSSAILSNDLSTSITSQIAEPTQTPSDTQPAPSTTQPALASKSSDHKKILGIVLGVVLGSLVIAVALCIFLICRRRRRRGGLFRRYETPAGESEIDSWRVPVSNHFATQVPEKYGAVVAQTPTSRYTSNGTYHNANTLYQNDQALRNLEGAVPYENMPAEDNPFYTPEERQNLRSSGHIFNEHARVPHNFANPDRPPTPFASVCLGVPARKPVPSQGAPLRASQDMVHYPSRTEASDFNFGFAHSKAHDFGDPGEAAYHPVSGGGWNERGVHPAYRT